MRILVVDYPATRTLIGCSLAANGWDVKLARDHADALRMATGFSPDVLICEWMLPTGPGTWLVQALRASSPGLFVIFLSALPLGVLAYRARNAHSCVFLPKPFRWGELEGWIRALAGPRARLRTCHRSAAIGPPVPGHHIRTTSGCSLVN